MILRLLYPFARVWWALFPKVVLGTRVMVIQDGRVLLVKMTYLKNWYFPGGGVDRNESLSAAAAREVLEETAYKTNSLKFLSMYFDSRERASNHIALFLSSDVSAVEGARPDFEIEKVEWFPLSALPEGLSPATRRRLDEYVAAKPATEIW